MDYHVAPIMSIDILERVSANPRGGLHIRSYQARITDRRRQPPQVTELKVQLSIQAAVEDVLNKLARTL